MTPFTSLPVSDALIDSSYFTLDGDNGYNNNCASFLDDDGDISDGIKIELDADNVGWDTNGIYQCNLDPVDLLGGTIDEEGLVSIYASSDVTTSVHIELYGNGNLIGDGDLSVDAAGWYQLPPLSVLAIDQDAANSLSLLSRPSDLATPGVFYQLFSVKFTGNVIPADAPNKSTMLNFF